MTEQMTRKKINSRIAEEIDRNLRQAFDDMAEQPVPDRFTDLLAQLKSAESTRKGGGEKDA
ncbi:DNA-directed RNA polymerase sigma-70 factor [Antarctobacter heliothermus]|uniref:DNA-directed RNA polymerase sigma-70 factor n=2 Tax=Antarctobacter heliothermus TaxID=74033 RepID=A0A222DXW0_9RHOB|nr:DNA-directed RNA polymerase sigma-70 factor [Antarctobacter heliothermus]